MFCLCSNVLMHKFITIYLFIQVTIQPTLTMTGDLLECRVTDNGEVRTARITLDVQGELKSGFLKLTQSTSTRY